MKYGQVENYGSRKDRPRTVDTGVRWAPLVLSRPLAILCGDRALFRQLQKGREAARDECPG